MEQSEEPIVDENLELQNHENLIEKYADFLTFEEYANCVINKGSSDFWKNILKGINEKIRFLNEFPEGALNDAAQEEIKIEAVAATLLHIHNESFSEKEYQQLLKTYEVIGAASKLMEFQHTGGRKKSKKTKKSKKKRKTKKIRKTKKSKKIKSRTKKRKNRRIKKGGVAVGREEGEVQPRNVWNLIDFLKLRSNIRFYIDRLAVLLGFSADDKYKKRQTGAGGSMYDKDNFTNYGEDGLDIDIINSRIRVEQAELSNRETLKAASNLPPNEIEQVVIDANMAEKEAREKSTISIPEKKKQAKTMSIKEKNIENNKGYFILGKRLGNGGSFKTPYQLLYCQREAARDPYIREYLKNTEFFNVNEISVVNDQLFFIDFEDILKENDCKVIWEDAPAQKGQEKRKLYLIKSYIFLKIDNFTTSRQAICDEYVLGTKIFDNKYPPKPGHGEVSLAPQPLKVYYKDNDGNYLLDNRIVKQDYGIRSGGFTFSVCKTCNTEQTSGLPRGMTTIPDDHFKKIALAFYKLIFELDYLSTDIKPDNMCMTMDNSLAQFIDFDEKNFFDKRWSINTQTSSINHRKAIFCYMLLQYISTYYLFNLHFSQIYKYDKDSPNLQSNLFIDSLKETLVHASELHRPNLDLLNFFKVINDGKDIRAHISDIDEIIKYPKIDDGCSKEQQHSLSSGERMTCADMFRHYHEGIYVEIKHETGTWGPFPVSLSTAEKFVRFFA